MKLKKFLKIGNFFQNNFFLIVTNFLLLFVVFLSNFVKIKTQSFFLIAFFLMFFFSYLDFKKNKKLSKEMIVINFFIFFYFFSKNILSYISNLFGREILVVDLVILFLIVFCFYLFIGNNSKITFSISKMELKPFFYVLGISVFMSIIFFILREPTPYFIKSMDNFWGGLGLIVLISALVSFTEEIIFLGIFYTTYIKFFSKKVSKISTSVLFGLFHIVEITFLIHYFKLISSFYYFYLIFYFIALFTFMQISIYFFEKSYNIKTRKYNLAYSIFLHFLSDCFLLFLTFFVMIYFQNLRF